MVIVIIEPLFHRSYEPVPRLPPPGVGSCNNILSVAVENVKHDVFSTLKNQFAILILVIANGG